MCVYVRRRHVKSNGTKKTEKEENIEEISTNDDFDAFFVLPSVDSYLNKFSISSMQFNASYLTSCFEYLSTICIFVFTTIL